MARNRSVFMAPFKWLIIKRLLAYYWRQGNKAKA
mgnify:CR=1|jgi:hypothetical protein